MEQDDLKESNEQIDEDLDTCVELNNNQKIENTLKSIESINGAKTSKKKDNTKQFGVQSE